MRNGNSLSTTNNNNTLNSKNNVLTKKSNGFEEINSVNNNNIIQKNQNHENGNKLDTTNTTSNNHFDDLTILLLIPKDLWKFHICSYLNGLELYNLRLTSKFFYNEIVVYPILKQFISMKQYIALLASNQKVKNIYGIYGIKRFSNSSNLESILSSLPQDLCQLKLQHISKLTSLHFHSIPSSISILQLIHCPNIDDTISNFFPTGLKELSLKGSLSISDQIFTNSTWNLTKLDLSELKKKFSLDLLPTTLVELNLSFSKFKITSNFCNYLKLTSLDLSHTSITDAKLQFLPSSLVSLNLSYCYKITFEGLKSISAASNLKELNINNSRLIQWQSLAFFSNLKKLDLFAHLSQKPEFLDFFPPQLQDLTLRGSTRLKFPSTLTKLYFSNNSFTNETLDLMNLSLLTELNLSMCQEFKILEHLKKFSISTKITYPMGITGTPLYMSIYHGKIHLVKYFLDQGAPINPRHLDENNLLIACKNTNYEILSLLLERGGDVNRCNLSTGESPLSILSRYGSKSMIELCLKYNAEINHVDNFGETPLSIACRNEHIEIAELLLKRGARVDILNREQETPLLVSTRFKSTKIISLLLQFSSNINALNSLNQNALHIASHYENLDLIQVLISNGININQPDKDQIFPLYVASLQKNQVLINKLLSKGAIYNENDFKLHLFFPCSNCKNSRIEGILLLEVLEKNYYCEKCLSSEQTYLRIDKPQWCQTLISAIELLK